MVAEQLRVADEATVPAPEAARAGGGLETHRTQLVRAAGGGHSAAVRRLLAAGTDPNALVSGWTGVGLLSALCTAASFGHVEVARLLLEGGVSIFIDALCP